MVSMEDVTVAVRGSDGEKLVREALMLLVLDEDARVEELVDPCYRDHTLHGFVRGAECFRVVRGQLRRSFADVELIPRDVIVNGDRVAVRLSFRGLHVAPYAGFEPCGRTVEMDEIHIWRLQDGRLMEHWACRDERAALTQMGAAAGWPDEA